MNEPTGLFDLSSFSLSEVDSNAPLELEDIEKTLQFCHQEYDPSREREYLMRGAANG